MGLEILKDKGIEAVIVLGETAYYTRFGFSPDLAKDLESPYSGPNLMGLELRQGALAGLHGSLRYPRAFGVF
jgi:putative acetyltransferase